MKSDALDSRQADLSQELADLKARYERLNLLYQVGNVLQSTLDPQEALRVLDDARSRLRTAIWALHGMHQDLNALSTDDLADIEHLLTEVLDHAITPCFETMSQMVGTSVGGAVTTH